MVVTILDFIIIIGHDSCIEGRFALGGSFDLLDDSVVIAVHFYGFGLGIHRAANIAKASGDWLE